MVDNTPHDACVIENLRQLAQHILEPVQAHFKSPVVIHSGYRSPLLNTLVGGVDTSQHCKGQAVDFHVEGHTVYEVACWIRDHLDFDQLILEEFEPALPNSGWVHCSYSTCARHDAKTKFKGLPVYYKTLLLTPPLAPAQEYDPVSPTNQFDLFATLQKLLVRWLGRT